jgi:hypothetical protein
MNLHKGLNRVFILLGVVAAIFGCMFGGTYAVSHWVPSTGQAFQSTNWNDQENINRYYLTAKNIVEFERIMNKENQRKKKYTIAPQNLHNYKNVPPQYNRHVFKEAFPGALKTPVYLVWIGIVGGALLAFCICYGGLHSIRLVIKWIISGFRDK